MHLEVDTVESNLLTMKNAAAMLLLVDAHSCAFLKETAMELVVSKSHDLLKTKGSGCLKESSSLLAEVFDRQTEAHGSHQRNHESISNLRKQLADRGLDVDGSKEMLVKRLEN